MRSSENIEKLAEALCAAQGEMGGAVKGSANPFFKSSYADLTSVIKAIKEPCQNNGLSYVQLPHRSDSSIGVVTRLMHVSGQWLENEFTLPMVKSDPQAAGSAITYARRYALQALFGIPAVDDDGESAMIRGDKPKLIDESQLAVIFDLLDKTDSDVDKFCKAFHIEGVEAMLSSQFDKAMAALNRKLKDANK
jgi:hypothetical protein